MNFDYEMIFILLHPELQVIYETLREQGEITSYELSQMDAWFNKPGIGCWRRTFARRSERVKRIGE